MTQHEADVLASFGVIIDTAEINGIPAHPTPEPTPAEIIDMLEFFHVQLDDSDIRAIHHVYTFGLEMPQPIDCATLAEMQARHPGNKVFVESHDPTTAMIAVPLFYLEELERNQVEQTPDDTLYNLHLF